MKPEIKKLWTDALRSGEYHQGRRALNSEGRFCCLGVLCDLAVKAGAIPPGRKDPSGVVSYGACRVRLPPEVIRWAGLEDASDVRYRKDWDWTVDGSTIPLPPGLRLEHCHNAGKDCRSLATANDSGMSFPGIAAIIEEHL